MSATDTLAQAFFIAGGTMGADAGSYVERSADRELLSNLLAGKFCYVLTPRQMGKSSLCVRTMRRIGEGGVATAFVDLTRIGGRNVTADQWYVGIALEIGRSLNLRKEFLAFWTANGHLSPLQRLFGAIREVAIENMPGPIAVFVDEIDATRSLSFPADEFFGAIRECYNRRAHDDAYSRLTFCLLGVAVPSDLINSTTSTPFNIGERINLRDFTLDEAMTLAGGLGENGPDLLKQVYYWTHGHPYLTQSLCQAVQTQAIRSSDNVDALVRRDLFVPTARETNINLADVANRALQAGDLEANPEQFKSDLLSLYERTWIGKRVLDDEANRVASLLKLSGIVQSDGAQLQVRNRIYRNVFDRRWIRENMPGQELRRQRSAYWGGVLRTTCLSLAVVAIVGWLAAINARLARNNMGLAQKAFVERDRSDYQAYVAQTSLMRWAYDQGDLLRVRRLLAATATSPYRNIEWGYWNGVLHDAWRQLWIGDGEHDVNDGDGKELLVNYSDNQTKELLDLEFPSLSIRHVYKDLPNDSAEFFLVGGRALAFPYADLRHIDAYDVATRKAVYRLEANGAEIHERVASSARQFMLAVLQRTRIAVPDAFAVWSMFDGKLRAMHTIEGHQVAAAGNAISDDGRFAGLSLLPLQNPEGAATLFRVIDLAHDRAVWELPSQGQFRGAAFSADASMLALADENYIRLYRASDHKLLFSWPGLKIKLHFSRDGRRLMAVSQQDVSVYDTQNGQTLVERLGGNTAYLSPDGMTYATGYDAVRVYHVADVVPTTTPGPTTSPALYATPDGPIVVRASRTIRVFDGSDLRQLRAPVNISSLRGRISANGLFRLADVRPGGVSVLDNLSGKELFQIPGVDTATGMYPFDCVSEAGPAVVIEAGGRSVLLFSPGSKRILWRRSFDDVVESVSLSANSRRVGLGQIRGDLRLLDAATGKDVELTRNIGADAGFTQISPDGGTIVRNSDVIGIWHAGSKSEVRVEGSMYVDEQLQISPDGRRMITASPNLGIGQIWDLSSGLELTSIGGPKSIHVNAMALSADGNALYTLDAQGRVQRWPISMGR